VVNVFSLPTGQRLSVLLTSLGLGTSGRGDDINAILRRANPALTQARGVLAILARDRSQLTDAVGSTRVVLDRLHARDDDLRAFVSRAADLSEVGAANSRSLQSAIEQLPATLDETRAGLTSLRGVAASGTPVLRDLQAAAAPLDAVTRSLPAFIDVAHPAVQAVAGATRRGIQALPNTTTLADELAKFAGTAPIVAQARRLLVNLRARGGIESALKLVYGMSAIGGGYDTISHFVSASLNFYPACYGDGAKVPGCNHRYDGPLAGTVPVNAPASDPGLAGPPGPNPNAASKQPSATRSASSPPVAMNAPPSDERIRNILDYLLK
jgi:hypothetical protein